MPSILSVIKYIAIKSKEKKRSKIYLFIHQYLYYLRKKDLSRIVKYYG